MMRDYGHTMHLRPLGLFWTLIATMLLCDREKVLLSLFLLSIPIVAIPFLLEVRRLVLVPLRMLMV